MQQTSEISNYKHFIFFCSIYLIDCVSQPYVIACFPRTASPRKTCNNYQSWPSFSEFQTFQTFPNLPIAVRPITNGCLISFTQQPSYFMMEQSSVKYLTKYFTLILYKGSLQDPLYKIILHTL